ncbi:MAG: TonB-dependent receptor [Cyclobacteriaceae bacterium]
MSKTQLIKSTIALILVVTAPGLTFAQTIISGLVTDKKGEALPGVNIYLEDTYDGATSDLEGRFQFSTNEIGNQQLVISFVGYRQIIQSIDLSGNLQNLIFQMAEEINKMDGVTITAGSFEASDEKKQVLLKPLDIAMTAGATADIVGALNTLPGTTTNGESGRLFVRGGSGEETKVFIDGMHVPDFYIPSAPNTPGRSRFSPFLFKGTAFSTGGYSAEYGQALSSTLQLNSIDLPDDTETNMSFMTVGGNVSHSHLWEKSSVFAEIGYINLNPYIGLVNQAFDFEDGYVGIDGNLSFRAKTKSGGMFKVFSNFSTAGFDVRQFNINNPEEPNRTDLAKDYYFINATYKDFINDKWSHRSGASFTLSNQDVVFNGINVEDDLTGLHFKSVLENDHSEHVSLRFGSELFHSQVGQRFQQPGQDIENSFDENLGAVFSEADIYLSTKFMLRTGVRGEISSLQNDFNISPRVSLAYKTSEYGQVSAAFGQYYQSPDNEKLLIRNDLDFEKATHYILNYQVIKEGRIFRVEGYHKEYNDLLKFDRNEPFNPTLFNNSGFGHAQGIDLFWRDSKTFKNVDYWVSYSFLDTERDFKDFPATAAPSFSSRHNFSIVYKHFINPIRTQFGATYSFTSGRPYNNPNREGFNQERIPAYHNLSFNAAYLFKQHIIFYVSATNLTGRDNIFGYTYADQPNADGMFERSAIGQPAKRFYFLGVFITLAKDKSKNQLNNL